MTHLTPDGRAFALSLSRLGVIHRRGIIDPTAVIAAPVDPAFDPFLREYAYAALLGLVRIEGTLTS